MSTISKVAERAGVSRTTVSHVLNHAERVSKPLRDRVLVAIDELGYAPNPQAQSLRTGRTDVIALLIPDIRNPYYPELVKTAQSALEKLGLDTLIFNTDVPGGHSQEHAREYLRQIGRRRVDGVIVGDFALHGLHEGLAQLDIPSVFMGHLPSHAVDSVKVDDFGGGYQMGAHFAKKGHRRVALVTGPNFFMEAMARAEGFEQGFADNGGAIERIIRYEGTYLAPSGREAVRWLAETHKDDMPTAVFFCNYLMVWGGLAECYDLGIRVPGDMAVSVFADLPQLEYLRPRLTYVGISPSVLAERAVAMLLERLRKQFAGPPRAEIIPSLLMELDSA